MDKKCGTCKHLGDSASSSMKPSGYFICERIHFNINFDLNPGQGAFVTDGDMYSAALYVESDFGCSLWEAPKA